MNITTTTNLVLPFWQIAGLMLIAWAGIVGYRYAVEFCPTCKYWLNAWMCRRAQDASRRRFGVTPDQHRSHDGDPSTAGSRLAEQFNDHQETY
jgi:hypothetical protein